MIHKSHTLKVFTPGLSNKIRLRGRECNLWLRYAIRGKKRSKRSNWTLLFCSGTLLRDVLVAPRLKVPALLNRDLSDLFS